MLFANSHFHFASEWERVNSILDDQQTIFDIRYSNGALCDVRGQDDLPHALAWLGEHQTLFLICDTRVERYQP